MADNERDEQQQTGTSRRAALKAGVAAGIGLAAWTGPTITSIGGTPAYAATCTNFTVNTTSADRNTNQGNCPAGSIVYVKDPFSLPTGYSLDVQFSANGHCSADPAYTTDFTFPSNVTCTVNFRVYPNGNFANGPYNANVMFGPGTSPLSVSLPTTAQMLAFNPGLPINTNDRWSIRVQC